MDDKQRLQLKQMIKDNDVEDQTNKIREIKHSSLIRRDVIAMEVLKSKHPDVKKHTPDKFAELCRSQCAFLYENYTDIYNKLKNDELDLNIFNEFLNVLRRIENEELDQHEGSFEIGKLLKRLYVDSALRRADMNSANHSETVDAMPHPEPVNISWKEFKTMTPNDK
jgi:hypothetical protein